MLTKCQIVKLIYISVLGILVSHIAIKYVVYSTDPGGGGGSNGSSNNKQPVELDINSKKTTNQFTYTKSGGNNKVHTYEPKPGYGFNKVKQKKRLGSDKEVWSTDDSKEYASKVIFDENNNTVTITLGDGSEKKYKKSNDNWTEETEGSESATGATPESGGTDPGAPATNPSTPTTPSSGEGAGASPATPKLSGTTPATGTGSSEGSQPASTTPTSTPSTPPAETATSGGTEEQDVKHESPKNKEPESKQNTTDEAKFNELAESIKKDLGSSEKLKDTLAKPESKSKDKIKELVKAEFGVDVEVKVEGNDIGNNVTIEISRTGDDVGAQESSTVRVKKGDQQVAIVFKVTAKQGENGKIAKRLIQALDKDSGINPQLVNVGSLYSGSTTEGSTPASGGTTPTTPATGTPSTTPASGASAAKKASS